MKTTLNKIRARNPCTDGWKQLLSYLGKSVPDDEPLPILTVLDSNGLDDALWCLRAVEGHEREIRLYAVECARDVQQYMTDQRSIDALDVAESFANGKATKEELAAARAAAWVAAVAGGDEAAEAAWAATVAEAAAAAAAWATARAAARAVAEAAAAAWAAAWAAARAAARAVIRKTQTDRLRELCK